MYKAVITIKPVFEDSSCVKTKTFFIKTFGT